MSAAAAARDHAAALRDLHPEAILAWAVVAFRGRVALTVSFGNVGSFISIKSATLISEMNPASGCVFGSAV